uniref:Uncharacterized protein n=1 Tax=Plectus sambesii TaxID=2011161 RepID=A0A914W696_9BILA
MKSAFCETDPKYQCCCGSTTIKIGATVVGILEVVSVGIGLLGSVLSIFSAETANLAARNEIASPTLLFILALIGLLIQLTVAIILLIGIKREDPNLLLPWLIKAGFGIGVALIVFFATRNFFSLIPIAFELWFFYIVFYCRDYFVQKAKANQNLEWDSGPGITIVSDQYNTFATETGFENPVKIDLED